MFKQFIDSRTIVAKNAIRAFTSIILLTALCLSAQQSLGQQSANLSPGVTPGMASDIIANIMSNPDSKQWYFEDMSQSKSRQIAASADTPADSLIFKVLYDSKITVPDNLTDVNLAKYGKNKGSALKSFGKSKIQTIPSSSLRALESYPPQEVVSLIYGIARPWFAVKNKPLGAWLPTWASSRYLDAVENVRIAELAKRSVIVKLVSDEGLLTIPSTADLIFDWSGAPTISIDISFVRWSNNDLKELTRLAASGNIYYSHLAQERINLLPTH